MYVHKTEVLETRFSANSSLVLVLGLKIPHAWGLGLRLRVSTFVVQ